MKLLVQTFIAHLRESLTYLGLALAVIVAFATMEWPYGWLVVTLLAMVLGISIRMVVAHITALEARIVRLSGSLNPDDVVKSRAEIVLDGYEWAHEIIDNMPDDAKALLRSMREEDAFEKYATEENIKAARTLERNDIVMILDEKHREFGLSETWHLITIFDSFQGPLRLKRHWQPLLSADAKGLTLRDRMILANPADF